MDGGVRGGMLLHCARRHHRRNSVLENQLLLIAGFKHQRIFVEALDPPGKLDTAEEIDGY